MYPPQQCETVRHFDGTRGRPEGRLPRSGHFRGQTFAVLLVSGLLLVSCTSAAAPAPTATPDPKLALVGTWTATVTREDILGVVPDFPEKYLCENAGTFNWTFNADGTFTVDQTRLADCPAPANPHIEDTWAAEGTLVTFAKGTPNEEVYEWNLEGEMMSLKHVSGECMPCKAVNTAHPWKRVSASAAQ